jgi:hypothetical protein
VQESAEADISIRDKFRAALLAAKAVGHPARHSGPVVRQMLVDLGILNQVMQSAVIIKDCYSDLIAGKADLSIWALPCSHVVRPAHRCALVRAEDPDNSCAT